MNIQGHLPISETEFKHLMNLALEGVEGMEARPVVALSGGADSSALALLYINWCQDKPYRAYGIVCDHGLRDDSAEEANRVAERFRQLGMVVEVISLKMTYGSAIQERARHERYEAMLQTMRMQGYNTLLLGHHLYDQAETIAFRAMRNSGADGLAGMAVTRQMQDAYLVRPFLKITPERLRATLIARSVEWEEDPTNATGKYTRNKLRMMLASDPQARTEILQAGEVFAQRRATGDLKVQMRLQEAGVKFTSDWASLDIKLLGQDEIGIKAMSYLINRIGVNATPLSREAVSRILVTQKGTLGGAMLRKREDHQTWYLARESSYIEKAITVKAWATWDKRYRVGNFKTEEPIMLGAVGAQSWIKTLSKKTPMWVLETVPCFTLEGRVLALPTLGWYLDTWQNKLPELKPYGTLG